MEHKKYILNVWLKMNVFLWVAEMYGQAIKLREHYM